VENNIYSNSDTICAISTPQGVGGIAVIRVSGPDAIKNVNKIWRGKALDTVESHTAHLGKINGTDNTILDQGVATVFRAPRTFTGEDVVELSVHGSTYIQQQLLATLTAAGCRMAMPGEFTRRAFTNGRLDLTEAEAVADIIAASSRAAHDLAISQLRGDLSKHIDTLRDQLMHIASMLELELDFSEEDVTFADRDTLTRLATDICRRVDNMASTFATGDALRRGVPVAIVGRPNAGKSCLLNALLDSDRAIVSDIPGTTRDTVEETIDLNGITFRFIDTAGLRHTEDPVETLGIQRTLDKTRTARVVLWLIDPAALDTHDIEKNLSEITETLGDGTDLIAILNKTDTLAVPETQLERLSRRLPPNTPTVAISAKHHHGIDRLRAILAEKFTLPLSDSENLIVANARHHQALTEAATSLRRVLDGLATGQYTDLIAQDLRESIHHLSTITGTITTDAVLESIFTNFCIGK